MRTNREFILRKIAGEQVLIPTGEASQRLNGMIHLTETAAFMWEQVDQAENLDGIMQAVMDEFEVDEETASRDVTGFLLELYVREMIYDVPELEALAEQMRAAAQEQQEGSDLQA